MKINIIIIIIKNKRKNVRKSNVNKGNINDNINIIHKKLAR